MHDARERGDVARGATGCMLCAGSRRREGKPSRSQRHGGVGGYLQLRCELEGEHEAVRPVVVADFTRAGVGLDEIGVTYPERLNLCGETGGELSVVGLGGRRGP
jgi:hypothetical protein